LKVDTGMGRLGMQPSRALAVARRVASSAWLELDGIMSHLAGAGPEGAAENRRQAQAFAAVVASLRGAGFAPRNVHLRNTAGLLDRALDAPGETLARAGAALYGFSPAGRAPPAGFRAVLTLRTQIVFMKDIPAGQGVGYGGTWRSRRPTRLAIVPLGYHDGMKRGLANGGEALLRGRRVPVAGQVSMDYSTLDITAVPGARVGDPVTLIGADGEDRLGVEEVSQQAGTIPYDVLCGLGRRVVRVARERQARIVPAT
jgi:alanine racemase